MKRTTTGALAAALLLIGTAMAGSPASAAPKPTPITDAQYLAIAEYSLAHGNTVTAAQQAQMNTRPDLQRKVATRAIADYEMPGFTEPAATTRAASTDSAAVATTSTTQKDRYIVYDTGFPFYDKVVDYHFVVAWSYNGVQVIGTPSSYTYIKNADGGVQNLGIVRNDQYRNYNSQGVYAWTVPLTGKWKNCVGNACDFFYPQVRFGVYYNGTYNYVVLTKQ